MIKFVRGLVLWLGLGVLGVSGLVELILRRRSAGHPARLGPDDSDHDDDVALVAGTAVPPLSRTRSRVRMVVAGVGVAMALYGAYLMVRTVPSSSYLAIAIWLAAAVLLHDAVLVPAVFVLREGAVRVGRGRLPAAAVALVEGAFVVVGVLSLVAVPEIWAKHLGPVNPTVLPGSYGIALVVTWVVVAALTVAGVVVLAVVARGRRTLQSGVAR